MGLLQFLFGLIGPAWRSRVAGAIVSISAFAGGVANDIDESKDNDTNWAIVGPIVLAGFGISQSRPNNVSSEKAGAVK